MPSTSSKVPFSSYENTKMSSASNQEFCPPVEEPDFSAITEQDQYDNNDSSYKPLNSSNIPGNHMISLFNNIQENMHGNTIIPNTHAKVDTRMANKATVLITEANVAPGSYIFSARIPPGTKVKRSVPEHNRGKTDSDELSPKREKVTTPEYFGCDALPAYINSNNQFHGSNMQNDELPTSGEERIFQTLINDILTDPYSYVHAAETWLENMNSSMTTDRNNFNQNNLDQNNVGYSIHNPEALFNDNCNLSENIAHNFIPNDVGHNLHMNNGDYQHNVVEIDFEKDLSAGLKRGLNVSE